MERHPPHQRFKPPFRVRESFSYDGADYIVDAEDRIVDPQWICDRLNAEMESPQP